MGSGVDAGYRLRRFHDIVLEFAGVEIPGDVAEVPRTRRTGWGGESRGGDLLVREEARDRADSDGIVRKVRGITVHVPDGPRVIPFRGPRKAGHPMGPFSQKLIYRPARGH